MHVLCPRLQDGFKIPKFDPRAHKGIYTGSLPLHASTVGMIYNPKTTRISPQFHCIYNDYFETVSLSPDMPQKKMDDLWTEIAFEGYERIDI